MATRKKKQKQNKINRVNENFFRNFEVRVFSKSEELNYLKRLVQNRKYDDKLLFNKLFFSYNSAAGDNSYYLKNKYLYETTRGVISYLRLKEKLTDGFSKFETEQFEQIFASCDSLSEKVSIISIGAADSSKEVKILEKILQANPTTKIDYVPVDTSPMLIQLGINNLSSNITTSEKIKAENLNIKPIVADFFHLAEYIRNAKSEEEKETKRKELFGEEGNRIFLVLGETFCNYKSEDFLEPMYELVNEDDKLFVSLKLVNNTSLPFSDEELLKKNDFLLSPLRYVPYYFGYTQDSRRFLMAESQPMSGEHWNIYNSYIEVKEKKIILCQEFRYKKESIKDVSITWSFFTQEMLYSKPQDPYAIIRFKKKDSSTSSSEGRYSTTLSSIKQDILNQSFDFKVYSKSEELSFFNHIIDTTKKDYVDKDMLEKFFNQYEESNSDSDYYLKNKYLYITTRGILNYLRLYEAQKESLRDFFTFEKKELRDIILDCYKHRTNENKLQVISLGAAISDKEAEVFKDLLEFEEITKDNVEYIPVDISPMLLQLGINNFSKNEIFRDFKVTSIVADFWDMAKYVRNNDISSESKNESKKEPKKESEKESKKKSNRQFFFGGNNSDKRLFLILGGTFGNYEENEFLNQVVELMDEEDELMISVKLQQNKNNYSTAKEYKDLPGNDGFLLEPLTYIPVYHGYSRYYGDYLVTDHNSDLTEEDNEINFVSVVPKSVCSAPYIEVERFDNQNDGESQAKLRLAWSTRYNSKELKTWINDTYELKNTENTEATKNTESDIVRLSMFKLAFCNDAKKNIWYHEEHKNNSYAVLRLKKVKKSYNKEILEHFYKLRTKKDKEVEFKNLLDWIDDEQRSSILDLDYYDEIKSITTEKKLLSKLKETKKQLGKISNEKK